MNIKILTIIFILVAGNANARQVITGKVVDKETSQPIENVSAELLQLPDSSIVEATSTRSDGVFMFSKGDTAKVFCVRIKHMSYRTLVVPVSKKTGMINNVGLVSLEIAVIGMKEVVVGAYKVRVTELPDRTVYSVPSDMKKTSTDGLDVLRKMPSVQVDYLNENITVDGKTNIKLEVDGVTRDKEYFKRLHPSQVAKVEVITSPSGKYDAETDAVINIITDSEMRYGLKGMVNAMLLPNSTNKYMGSLNTSFDYGFEKISYYIAANGGVQKFAFQNDVLRDANGITLNQNGVQSMKGWRGNFNTGIIYNPNATNNINLNVSYNQNDQNFGNNVFSDQSGSISSKFGTTSNGKSEGGGLTSLVYYKHKFDKNTLHSIEFESSYYNSLGNIKNVTDYQNILYALDGAEIGRDPVRTEENKSNRQSLSAQATYTLPFDSVYTFVTGVNSNFNYYKLDNFNSLTSAPNLDYKDLRAWLFAELTRTFKWGSIKIGTRLENSSVTINSANKNNYVSPLPYANGQYKINQVSSIKLAYTRRVTRPTSGDLNPFVSQADSLTVSHGNPDLKPAYRDNFQLTYNLRVGKGKVTFNLSPQLFYEYRTGLIQRISTIIPNTNRIERYPQNISDGYEAGTGLTLNAQLSIVMINSNVRYSLIHVDRYKDQINALDKKGWNWNTYLVCPLPKDFRFFTVFYMTGPTVNGQEVTTSDPFYLFGIQKQFKNNSSLNIITLNPFTSRIFNSNATLRNNDINQKTHSYADLSYAIMVQYSYTFKIGKTINAQKRGVEQEAEDNGFIKMPF
jgi:outer membrane receptor protein involved in Fe transport